MKKARTLNILYLVLYSARSRNLTSHILVCRVKNGNIGYSSLVLYSARDKNVTYIVDFSGFKGEISQL